MEKVSQVLLSSAFCLCQSVRQLHGAFKCTSLTQKSKLQWPWRLLKILFSLAELLKPISHYLLFFRYSIFIIIRCERLTKRVWEKEQTERQKHMYCVFVSRPVNEIYGLNCVCVCVRVCVFWHVWRGVWASRGKAHKTHDHTDEVTGSETGESLSFPVSFHPSLSYLHSSISRLYSCFSVFLTLCFYGIFQYVTRHWKTRKGVFWWLMIAFSINQALVLTLKLCCLHQDFLLRMCSHTWCTFVSYNGYGFLSFICLYYFSKKQK